MNKILKLGLTVCLFAIPAKFAVAKDLQLLNLNNADKQVCYQSQMLPKVIETQRYITRYKYPYKEGNFELYLDGLIRQINWYAGQLASDKKSLSFTIGLENMKKNLITAAEKNAWTRLDWTGKGASPAFATSLLVRSISYTYAILDSEGQLSNKEKDLLNKWVTKMIPNTTKKVNTLDTELNSYNALMSWGAVTQNYKMYNKGKSKFYKRVENKIRTDSTFTRGVRHNNEITHQLVTGAEILALNGEDILSHNFKGKTLSDMIEKHSQWVYLEGANKTKTEGDMHDPARKIMRSQGFGTHLAWIPICLTRFPDSKPVLTLRSKLRETDQKPFYGKHTALHTGCVYGNNQ